MRTRRNKQNKTNKLYWITGATCTILAAGVFWFTSPLSSDTTHSNQEPNQTEMVQAQKDRQSQVHDMLESINKEYKRKAKDKKVKDTADEIETVETEETQADESYLEQPETEPETEANKKAFEEQKAMGKGKPFDELFNDYLNGKSVDHDLLLLAAMNYDTEFRDFYLKAASGQIPGYVTAQNNTTAIIWDAGCANSQYKGTQGNESLQDFYMNVEETENEDGGEIIHQGIIVRYKTIWLNPGLPATGSLYQITNVEKVN